MGRRYGSQLAQDALLQAYKRLIEEEGFRRANQDVLTWAQEGEPQGDLQSVLELPRQTIVNMIKQQHVPETLMTRVRMAKDQATQLSHDVQRALSEAQKTSAIFETEIPLLCSTLNGLQRNVMGEQALREVTISEIESVLTKFGHALSLGGFNALEAFPEGTFVRHTGLLGSSTGPGERQVVTYPTERELFDKMLAGPLTELQLDSVVYSAGHGKSIQFIFCDGS